MPVEFLSDEQAARYGRYTGDPTPAQLARYFFLTPDDHARIDQKRGSHNRLGFALQLCTLRFLGTFLADPTEVPEIVVQDVARQLAIRDTQGLARYLERRETRFDHAREIRQMYGYREYTDQPEHFRLIRWLFTRAWLSDERPSVLFDLTTHYLIDHQIVLPGVTVLAREVARVRERAATRLHRVLAHKLTAAQRQTLDALLTIPDGGRISRLEQLRTPPTRISTTAMVKALQRLDAVRTLGVAQIDLSHVPAARLHALERYATLASTTAIARMNDARRHATLLALAAVLTTRAQDDALDLLDALVVTIIRKAQLTARQNRLRVAQDIDQAALLLSTACAPLIDPECPAPFVRAIALALIPREELAQAINQIETLARPAEVDIQPELIERYHLVRRFVPTLLRTLRFNGTPAGRPVLKALAFLTSIEGQRDPDMRHAPREVVPRAWRSFVFRERREVDRKAYTLCTLEQLQAALRRHDVYVHPSERWGDVRARLLQGADWEAQRANVCRMLNHQPTPDAALERLHTRLDTAFRRVAENLSGNSSVTIETLPNGQERLHLQRLDQLERPASLRWLDDQISHRLPLVDLTEIMLELHYRTGFLDEFTPISGERTRIPDLPISIAAVLLSLACNIGLDAVVQEDVPALRRRRLAWVLETFIRADTLTRANACLVDAQQDIPLVQVWGSGEVASADGLRFVVPLRTLNAGPSSRYFGVERGVTYYNYISSHFAGFHGLVIPGAMRDAPYILDGLLEQQTSLRPTELMTDTGGYSDLIFGLFWLLGYQFSPRLADAGGARFWRMDRHADYHALNRVSRHVVNTRIIAEHWDDLLRIAGSLKLGVVRASTLIRALLASQRPSTLTRALIELGRIAKTLYLLAYIDDEAYRRRVLTQLNRGEARHDLARDIFYGRRGELRQRYREGQEDQLSALGLAVNGCVLWNTWYMDQIVTMLRNQGVPIHDADLARIWPLKAAHIRMVGRYQFTVPEEVAQGAFRPLRDPDAADDIVI